MTTELHQELREWARGMHHTVAATELLIRAGYATGSAPWVKEADGRHWIDFDSIPDHTDGLSGGEKRILEIAASIGGLHRVVLQDVISGLDRDNAELAIATLSHAAGHHEGGATIVDGQLVRTPATPILPWPSHESPNQRARARTSVEGSSLGGAASPGGPSFN